jgi:hypothetical protein
MKPQTVGSPNEPCELDNSTIISHATQKALLHESRKPRCKTAKKEVSYTCVVNSMASYFKFLDRHLAISREEQNIPILEPHCDCGIENAQPVVQEKIWKKIQTDAKEMPQRKVLGSPTVPFTIPRLAEARENQVCQHSYA